LNTKPVEAALDKRPAISRVCMDVIPLGIRPGINNVGLRWYRTIADYPILIRPCQRVDCDDIADFIMAEIYRHRECSFRGDDHVRNVSIDGRRVPSGETTLNRCEVDLLRHLLRRLSLHHLKVTQYREEGIKLLLCLNETKLSGCVRRRYIERSATHRLRHAIENFPIQHVRFSVHDSSFGHAECPSHGPRDGGILHRR